MAALDLTLLFISFFFTWSYKYTMPYSLYPSTLRYVLGGILNPGKLPWEKRQSILRFYGKPVGFTLDEAVEYTEIVKKSRFVARAAPAASLQYAMRYLDEVKDCKANHNCWAYMSPSGEGRCNDDGEPAGTAGRPMLNAVESEHVVGAIVIVTRYFGGIKLGTGGLIRAYGSIAKAALLSARKTEYVATQLIRVCVPLDEIGALYQVIQHFQTADQYSAVFEKLTEEYIVGNYNQDRGSVGENSSKLSIRSDDTPRENITDTASNTGCTYSTSGVDSVCVTLRIAQSGAAGLRAMLQDACKGKSACEELNESTG